MPTVLAITINDVWWENGEENVVLWKSKINEYGIDQWGDSFDTPIRTSHIRFKAESVEIGNYPFFGNAVNITGAYYERDGDMTPAPDYQNGPGFSAWGGNSSYYINDTILTHYQGFWNAKDVSLASLDNEYVPLVFVNSPIMLVAIFFWVFGNLLSIDKQTGDIETSSNSTEVISKTARSINYIITLGVQIELLGSYPTESNAWTNSTLIMTGEVFYGANTNVLRLATLDMNMTLSEFNNNTKEQDITSNTYLHTLNAIYPSEVYQDISTSEIPGFPFGIIGIVSLISILYLGLKMKKKSFIK